MKRYVEMEHMNNLRTLGGYKTERGVTRADTFYRGDKTSDLSEEEIERLKALGITCVVDLRADVECDARPSSLQNVAGLQYARVPLFDGFLLPYTPATMGEVYVQLLNESPAGFAEIARLGIATPGACLFHCTSGKDRTGITAMLLLQLAGVSEEDVTRDFCLTEVYAEAHMNHMMALMHERGTPERAHMFTAKASEIKTALTYLRDEFGGARGYLARAGLNGGEIAQLTQKLVKKF